MTDMHCSSYLILRLCFWSVNGCSRWLDNFTWYYNFTEFSKRIFLISWLKLCIQTATCQRSFALHCRELGSWVRCWRTFHYSRSENTNISTSTTWIVLLSKVGGNQLIGPALIGVESVLLCYYSIILFCSVLWCCWLGARKGIWRVKTAIWLEIDCSLALVRFCYFVIEPSWQRWKGGWKDVCIMTCMDSELKS